MPRHDANRSPLDAEPSARDQKRANQLGRSIYWLKNVWAAARTPRNHRTPASAARSARRVALATMRPKRFSKCSTASNHAESLIRSRSKIGAKSAGTAPRLSERSRRPVQSSNVRYSSRLTDRIPLSDARHGVQLVVPKRMSDSSPLASVNSHSHPSGGISEAVPTGFVLAGFSDEPLPALGAENFRRLRPSMRSYAEE